MTLHIRTPLDALIPALRARFSYYDGMADTSEAISDIVRVLDLTGVAANALLGGTLARALKADFVGFVILGVVSGLGGGIIRDTLLQHGTPVALTDYLYLPIALSFSFLAFLLHLEGRRWDHVFVLVDALALGCWAAAGAQITLAAGLGWLPAILLGTITVIGGGMIRDILVLRQPQVLHDGPMYAVCAVIASTAVVVATYQGYSSWGTIAAVVLGGGLSLLARKRNWHAPGARNWKLPVVITGPPKE